MVSFKVRFLMVSRLCSFLLIGMIGIGSCFGEQEGTQKAGELPLPCLTEYDLETEDGKRGRGSDFSSGGTESCVKS